MSPNRILATAFLFASAFASADVHIDESIPYRDKEEIDTRIVSECLEVGSMQYYVQIFARNCSQKRCNCYP